MMKSDIYRDRNFTRYIDENGNSIERTPRSHPYSYDGYVIWRGGVSSDANGTIYTDRLSQWDYKKCERLKQKHFGNTGDYWDNRKPSDIEAFLSDWLEKQVKLILLMQYCNVSNGYPLWRLDYKE